MICPHCSKNLLRRQRGGSKCGYCKRTFAFDPKTNDLGLNDLKVRRLAAKLSTGGLAYTRRQLWYALSRKVINVPIRPLNGCGCGVFVLLTLLVIAFAAVFQPGEHVLVPVVTVAVLVFIGVNIIFVMLRPVIAARREISPPVGEAKFGTMLSRWREIYGANPPGMIDTVPRMAVQAANAAVVCPDGSVLDCLIANGVPQRNRLVLALNAAGVPPEIPVIILHDASVAGLRFATATKAALPGRVVIDAGLRPSTVLRYTGLLRLRGAKFDTSQLRGFGLAHQEVAWLAAGWWSPLGAVPPAKLVSAVDKAVARTDRSRAAGVGFMTWPG